MLAVAPELVRPDQLATAGDPDRTAGIVFAHPVNSTSRSGMTGSPSRVSVANGRRWFEWMSVRRGMAETPPLDQSDFTRGG